LRNAFADEVAHLGVSDKRLVLLSGDIGNKLFDRFKAAAPERFFNCGVAEANMMSVASGMALSGLRPVVYTITPFTTYRCIEQIRVGVCYHKAPVVIVGTGSGLSYAELGPTHHSLEDLAMLRSIPGMRVYAPIDAKDVRRCLRDALDTAQPAYIRIGKKGEPDIPLPPDHRASQWSTLRDGKGGCLIACGVMVSVALEVARHLSPNIDLQVIAVSMIKPLDESVLHELSKQFKSVFTLEEHSVIGGMGAAIAEWKADQHAPWRLKRFGTRDEFLHETGSTIYARDQLGIGTEHIAQLIRREFARP
jgi:transketolase